MFVYHRFELNKRVQSLLRDMDPLMDEFGKIIFYRTYSRIKENGEYEDWADCVIRVTNGTFSIRKDWYIKNHISWDEIFWQEYARKFAISMFRMEWMPPGRGLWAMGTQFVYERGSMALQNCLFTEINDEIAEDIGWLTDGLMNGCGVGFEPLESDSLKLHMPKGFYDYVIPDMREGWVDSIKAQIRAFTLPNQKQPRYIYDEIRDAGTPIKGFGGICSGPDPLKLYHDQIRHFCIKYISDKSYSALLLKTDLANCSGTMTISGNVRRSAELCKGSINNQTFLDLKDYNKYPYRAGWGYMSNNSAALEHDEDFEKLGEIAKRVVNNGEPGYLNLRNFPFGRIGKEDGLRPDRARGINPCGIQLFAALVGNN